MIELYYFPSPNGLKIAIMLEECGLPYQLIPVEIGSGEQFRPEYLAVKYSIADIACWPWIVFHERRGQNLDDFRHVKRWFEVIRERPAVVRGFALGHEQIVDRESYEFLYGQTAACVKEHQAKYDRKDHTR